MFTNVRKRNKIQLVKDIKAVKRRVGEESPGWWEGI